MAAVVALGVMPRAAGSLLDNHGGIQNDHRSSRSSRITCAALRLLGIGFARCVRSSHSRIVGRAATRSNSLLMKSERLMPSRAARDLRAPYTDSGTSRICIIFGMSRAYKMRDTFQL
jgi:hypothetical protein